MKCMSPLSIVACLILCGCQLPPLALDRFVPAATSLDDIQTGERYVFLMEPDESGAAFQYVGEVQDVSDREIILQDAVVDVHLESSRSMFRQLFGEKEPVASKQSRKKLVVETERVKMVKPEAAAG